MNTVKLLQYSLDNALGILGQVTADLTQEQANWTPPGIANPIGGLYWHTIASMDMVMHSWGLGQAPLFQQEGWQKKVVVSSAAEERKDHPPEIRDTIVNLAALREYEKVVVEATQGWLAPLTPEDLERKIETPHRRTQPGASGGELYRMAHQRPLRRDFGAKGLPGRQGLSFLTNNLRQVEKSYDDCSDSMAA